MTYGAFHIRAEELAEALQLLAGLEFIGANLTLPHKAHAVELVDELDDFARKAGAVNTLRLVAGRWHGSNTDGPGFARAIRKEFSVDLRDLRVLLLGAGGAARAIALQCAAEGCERLVLANRNLEKAQQLAAELKSSFSDTRVAGPVARLEAIPWEERALRLQIANVDLVVNATPLGLRHSDPSPLSPSLLAPHLMVFDTNYTTKSTSLLKAAEESGARGCNGLSMLLWQGALAFEEWFEREAPVEAMRTALG